MRIISQQSDRREVFAWSERVGVNDDQTDKLEFFLSPFAKMENNRRPVNRYDTRDELLAAANARNCRVTWQDS